MPLRSSRLRQGAAAGAGLVLFLALGAAACGGHEREAPVASLSASTAAERAFVQVRRAWERHDEAHEGSRGAASGDTPDLSDGGGLLATGTLAAATAEDRALTERLRVQLDGFLSKYPNDGLAVVALAYLAFVQMEQNDWAKAHESVAALAVVPPGSTENLVMIARARLLRHDGKPDEALSLLRPLVGKVVDPIARGLFLEEISLDAVAAKKDYEALAYLDAWLRGASEDRRDVIRTNVQMWVAQLPPRVLEDTYRAMRESHDVTGYGTEIQQLVGAQLGAYAVAQGDSELARWLLDPEAGVQSFGDAGAQVAELATSLRGIDSVVGRTLGVLIPTSSDPAIALLRGIAWAFDVPRIDPNAEEGVRFVTHDEGGDPALTERALEELVGQGASIIVAGLDPASAARALAWGERRGVAVISVVPPAAGANAGSLGAFGFTVGEARAKEIDALTLALHDDDKKAAGAASGAAIGVVSTTDDDRSRSAFFASCSLAAPRAGDPRFPFAAWSRSPEKVRDVLVAGSVGCARDAIEEAADVPVKWTFGLTFDATWTRSDGAQIAAGRRPRRLAVAAGLVPVTAPDPAHAGEDELRNFMTRFDGRPNWFAALGRDAGRLARQALAALPTSTVTVSAEVASRRIQARDALLHAHAHLWTTDADTFDGAHAVPRTLHVVELPR